MSISLLNIVGKVYERISIVHVKSIPDGIIGEEKCDFRTRQGCVDQEFVVIQVAILQTAEAELNR